jgi:acid phosphatase class B
LDEQKAMWFFQKKKVMNKIIYISLFLFLAFKTNAQHEADSIYVAGIDALISAGHDIKIRAFNDSLNYRNVNMGFHEDKLVAIHYKHYSCEQAMFYVKNDSLVCVSYHLSDPDIRSSLPPSSDYIIYFKEDKALNISTSKFMGGAKSCQSFSIDKKDFLKEFYYFKSLLKQKDE